MNQKISNIFWLLIVSTMLGGGMVHQANASHLTTTNPTCTCSAFVHFSKPELQFVNGVLTFIPRVDLTFSSRGPSNAPSWTANIAYSGSSSYSSKNISVPQGNSFSGEQTVANGMCGSRYTLKGYQLGRIPLTGITPNIVGHTQELNGVVDMQAHLTGCEEESLHKAFSFRLRELGNLFIRSWSSVH